MTEVAREERGLHISNLRRHHGSLLAVEDVSLQVLPGEVVGLLGPNGAGKTTTFRMICGALNAEKGEVRLNGQDLTHLPMHRRARAGLGYLPQEGSVFRNLSVTDNIRVALDLRRDLSRKQRKERLEQLLEQYDLTGTRKTLGRALSGGVRRRTEIARALAANPAMLLLDEPFAGVDPLATTSMRENIRDLATSGIGILITDHNARETLRICHRTYIIVDGRVISQGSTADILKDDIAIQNYLGENFQF